jgi:RHS repeat-associated protein
LLYSLRNGLPRFNRYNGRGDVVAQSDIDGTTTWAASYQADGRRTAEAGTNVERHRANCLPKATRDAASGLVFQAAFAAGRSKEEDPTGLLNEGFRYRDMETGTFISRDPLGLVDGPNVYCYVRQNPWSAFDPDGLSKADVVKFLTRIGKSVDDVVANYSRGADAVKKSITLGGGKDGRALVGGHPVNMPKGINPGDTYTHPTVMKPVKYDANGFPEFGPYIQSVKRSDGSLVRGEVKIKMTGDSKEDMRRANAALGIKQPSNMSWHHHQDGETMQLVPYEINDKYKHTGGDSVVKHANGNKSIFEMAESIPEMAASALAPNTVNALKSVAGTGATLGSTLGIVEGAAKDAIDNATEIPLAIPKAISGALIDGAEAVRKAQENRINKMLKDAGLDDF